MFEYVKSQERKRNNFKKKNRNQRHTAKGDTHETEKKRKKKQTQDGSEV